MRYTRTFGAILAIFTAGCNGISASPTAPSLQPVGVPEAPVQFQPRPHFTLTIQPVSSVPTLVGDAWRGLVTVTPTISIVRPDLPVQVVTSCGTQTRTYRGVSSGDIFFSCLLGLGAHHVTARAETSDGHAVTAVTTATVAYPDAVIVPLHYAVILSSGAIGSSPAWTDVTFSVRTVDYAHRHHWDFGDGSVDTTIQSSVDHRFVKPSTGTNDRIVTVRVVADDGRLVATGRVIGKW